MLRTETKSRARALQLLYAWELRGAPPMPVIAAGLSRLTGPEPKLLDRAEELAGRRDRRPRVARRRGGAGLARTGGMSRIAVVERNILRLAILELRRGEVPPKVAIDEAVRLAHWFGGARAPGFVNGVLDGIARATGRL